MKIGASVRLRSDCRYVLFFVKFTVGTVVLGTRGLWQSHVIFASCPYKLLVIGRAREN